MEANELRIGNCIKLGNEIGIVKLVGEKSVVIKTPVSTIRTVIGDEGIEPLRLTDKWHEKFGIKKDGFGCFNYDISEYEKSFKKIVFGGDYIYLREGYTDENRGEDALCVLWNNDRKGIIPVHTFQNLYHALTGKELCN